MRALVGKCVRADVDARAWVCACAHVALLIQHATRRHVVICDLWLHHIFRHYLINGTIFGKMLLDVKCVFWFPLQGLFEEFLIIRRIQRDIFTNVKTSLCKATFILTWLQWNLNFLDRLSKKRKCSNIKFHKNPSSGCRVIPCGRTDRHDETNRRFSQLGERA